MVKDYGFLSSCKYSPKLLDHAKNSVTDARKTTSQKVISKAAEATGDLTGNKIADEIPKVLKTSQQNNSDAVK